VRLAEFRYELTEGGVICALRDICEHFHGVTGESYRKNGLGPQATAQVFNLP